MSPDKRMYIEEVAKYVGIGIGTLRRPAWRAKNKFPMGLVGRDLVSNRDMLDKWEEDRLNGRN